MNRSRHFLSEVRLLRNIFRIRRPEKLIHLQVESCGRRGLLVTVFCCQIAEQATVMLTGDIVQLSCQNGRKHAKYYPATIYRL